MQIGYDPDFIGDGISIPLPTLGPVLSGSVLRREGKLRNDIFADHLHFTLVMNRHTRQLIYSAYNIDQTKLQPDAGGKKSWTFDEQVGDENQLGNKYYKDRTSPSGEKIANPYDRGHMVMRFNNMWGTETEADEAGKATFIYSNASLQHENLNRDEWKEIEMEVVRKLQDDTNGRLSVFTGPIYGDLDRHVNLSDTDTARVPSGFFKVICFRLKGGEGPEKLGIYAFAVFQDSKVLRDKKGHATVKTDRSYQVTIKELQQLTGLNFGDELFDRNPLFYFDKDDRDVDFNVSFFPERIPINNASDVVIDPQERRSSIEPLSKRRVSIMAAMINPVGKDAGAEWITLLNRSEAPVDLKDWSLKDHVGRSTVLKHVLDPGESIKLLGKDLGTVKLANQGGALMLHDAEGRVIDHVTWAKNDIWRLGEGRAFMFERGQ